MILWIIAIVSFLSAKIILVILTFSDDLQDKPIRVIWISPRSYNGVEVKVETPYQ